jgi:hypothetical protein
VCDTRNPLYLCSDESVCLYNTSPEVVEKGIDINDIFADQIAFNNIYETIVYIFRVLTYDNWSDIFILFISSDLNTIILLFLFLPSVILSIIIHGLIIATFFNTISKLKNSSMNLGNQYKAAENIAFNLMRFISSVEPKQIKHFFKFLFSPYKAVAELLTD